MGADNSNSMANSATGLAKSTSCSHIDLYAPETQEAWYPAYDQLREHEPVYQIPGTNVYVLTRYEDVAFVSRRTDVFANGPAPDAALVLDPEALRIYRERGRVRRGPLGTNPPIHRRYRALVDPLFTQRAAEVQRPFIESVVHELIDRWIDEPTGEIEFVQNFALPLPVRIITSMLGFPLEDMEQLKIWSEAWVMPFAGRLTAEQQRYVAEQGVEFQHYILDVVAEKRKRPDDSVISYLAHSLFDAPEGPRPLSDEEVLFTTDHLYIGGNETTTFALASGMWLMLRDGPDIQRTLRDEPSHIPQFVEEVLRLESPTQGLFRNATEDIEVNGTMIPKGSTVHMRFAAANRDPRMFPEPTRLDLDRTNSARHVAFGQGEHHCPGAGLSRVEQHIAFEALLDRTANWELANTNDYRHMPGFVLRALNRLDLKFTR